MPGNMADVIEQMRGRFSERLQRRLDWIESVVPHPAGYVKLTDKEQLALYDQRAADPVRMQALVKERGAQEVQKYVTEMEKLRNQHGNT